MTRRLLITDRYDDPALCDVVVGRHPGVTWDILLLGLSNDWFRWQHASAARQGASWSLVAPGPFAAVASTRAGDFLVGLVERLPRADLGGATLDELLATPEGSLWWFLEISEKGPFRGPLVTQFYQLALARAAIEHRQYDEVQVSLADEALSDVFRRTDGESPRMTVLPRRPKTAASLEDWPRLRYWLYAIGTVARVGATKALLTTAAAGGPDRAGRGLAAFTYYPSWWTRPFADDAADRFFSHLGDAGVSRYLAWLTDVRLLLRHWQHAARVMRARQLEPLQAHVFMGDLLGLLSLRRYSRTCRVMRRAKSALRETFEGFEVGGLVASELSRSITSSEVFKDELIARAVGRSASQAATRAVLYRLEFQPFENALLRGLRGRSRAIGFLHYPFGRHYLSTRFAPGEMSRYVRGAEPSRDRPLPDGVIACGPVGIGHVTNTGYPPARCAVCGPQRFGRLVNYRRQRVSREEMRVRLGLPADRPVYFVTLAILEEDTAALFAALAGAIEPASGARIVVRTHPNRPDGDPALWAALGRLPSGCASLMDHGADIYDHIVAADALIGIGSMIAFEAMALDRMPVVFENPSNFPALSLADFDDGLFVARDEADMRAALDAIHEDSGAVRAKRQRWPVILGRVLGDLEAPVPEQLARALSQLEASAGTGSLDAQRETATS